MNQAAQKLNIARTTLYTKISDAEIDPEFEQNVRTVLEIDINELRNKLATKIITPKSREDLEKMLSQFGGQVGDEDEPYTTGIQDIKRIAVKYKSWFDKPPLPQDLLDLYYAIANEHSSVKIFANLMSRLDIVEQKIQ